MSVHDKAKVVGFDIQLSKAIIVGTARKTTRGSLVWTRDPPVIEPVKFRAGMAIEMVVDVLF